MTSFKEYILNTKASLNGEFHYIVLSCEMRRNLYEILTLNGEFHSMVK
jgi:hypothetical protein